MICNGSDIDFHLDPDLDEVKDSDVIHFEPNIGVCEVEIGSGSDICTQEIQRKSTLINVRNPMVGRSSIILFCVVLCNHLERTARKITSSEPFFHN